MEAKNMSYSAENAERLAEAAVDQLSHRLEIKETKTHMLDKKQFYEFFASMQVPEEPSASLILAAHKRYCDFPKEFMQHCEIRDPSPIVDLEIYPRGVIVSSKIEGDISDSLRKPFSDRAKAEIVRLNRRVVPQLTFGKYGKHAFPSKIAYMQLLRDEKVAEVLLSAAKREEPYLGFIRVDYHNLVPRNNEPGWFRPKEIEWIKSLPVIIIPGISTEQLEVLVEKESNMLNER